MRVLLCYVNWLCTMSLYINPFVICFYYPYYLPGVVSGRRHSGGDCKYVCTKCFYYYDKADLMGVTASRSYFIR